ncbi:MAG: right-handed parallel beta-helix repeat-containing protein [Clostridia bacterium]|nr:right-handed parallel beta-helix repeat-containing protein [Clostridia bacterium]
MTELSSATMLAGETDTVTIALKMQETAGNEYQGKQIGDSFAIKLLATQLTSEKDSFDDQYDKATPWLGQADISWYDADAAELTVSTAEELAGLAAIVNGVKSDISKLSTDTTETTIKDDFEGQTIKLASDIDLNGFEWTPIGNVTFDRAGDGSYVVNGAFKGTFDGQGHTVSNLKIVDPAANGVGLFGAVVGGATVKNINVKNVNILADGTAAAVVGYCCDYSKTSTVENCHVSGQISIVADWAYVGGIVGYGHANISGCSVIADGTGVLTSENRNAVGGIMGWNYGATVTDCEVKNLAITGWTNVAGVEGYVPAAHTVSGCTVENVTLTKTRAEGVPAVGLLVGSWSYDAKATTALKNNTAKNVTMNGTHVAYSAYNELYGASYSGTTNTNFALENNTTENITNNLVEVEVVSTVSALKNALANGGDYVLTADVALDEGMTVPNGVTVTLNLNGKTISQTKSDLTAAHALIDNKGTLTINDSVGTGKISFTDATPYTSDIGWASNTIRNTGVLTVNGGTIENLTSVEVMSYSYPHAIDCYQGSTTTINGGTVKSANYDSIRMFCNSDTLVTTVTINGGTIINRVSFQDPATNRAGYGVLNINGGTFVTTDNVTANVRLLNFSNVCSNMKATVTAGSFDRGFKTQDIAGSGVVTSDWLTFEGGIPVNNLAELQAALDNAVNGDVIKLIADIEGNVTVTQKPNVKIVLDGNGKTFAGIITVDGKSATYTTAGLTIKNLTFKADSISADACINLGEENNNDTRYTCNVTVDNCTFDVPGAVGVKSYTGGDKNLTITGCTATANAHSLVQAKGIDGVLVENCEVYSKNGLNFNNSDNVTVKGCTVDVKGYAVRFGESSGGVGAAETYKIENCTLKSANDEGDATIILRGTADYSTLTIVNTTITGTPDINNTATSATVVK